MKTWEDLHSVIANYSVKGYAKVYASPEQLAEIRRVKLSRVLCDNSDDLETVQVYAMVLPDHEINPRVPCKSGVLPRLDLSKWRDASFHSAPSSTFFNGFGK